MTIITAGPLPMPRLEGEISLEKAIQLRCSVRSFQSQSLDATLIGQILWAAQGIRGSSGYRNAPSAGARYPLELYVLTAEAIFHYQVGNHSLEITRAGDHRAALMQAALDQEFILQAPVTIVIAAVPERTVNRYGKERSPRYIYLEVGHAAQNLMLQAAALGLGTVPVGAYNDEAVTQILALSGNTIPLYILPIGYPAE